MRRVALLIASLLLTPSPATLLRRFQPVLVLHPAEQFAPQRVDGFLSRALAERRLPDGTWAPADLPLPTTDPPGCTSTPDAPCLRFNLRECTPQFGVASLACYVGDERAHETNPVVYGAVHVRGKQIALQYWYWYDYDYWSGEDPPSDYVWQAHEGDWELVSVIVDGRGRPLVAGYSEHRCGKRRAWARVPRWRRTTHPIVHVAFGSHANSYFATTQPLDLRPACYPPNGAQLLSAFLHPPLDRIGNGATLGPALAGVRPMRIVRITPTAPSWMAFPGRWGEANYFHVPNLGTVQSGPAPEGPRFHAAWRDPVGTVRKWPGG